jgi:hypothetical protein
MLHLSGAVRSTVVGSALLLALASPARAQSETAAEELLRLGVALVDAGEHAGAVAWLERARELEPSDRIDLVLAESLVALGEYRRAEQLLARLEGDSSVNPLVAELARERLTALRARMGVVVVSVAPLPERAWLSVDGRRAELRSTTELRLWPGPVRLAVVSHDGTVLARTRALVHERGLTSVELAPVVVESAPRIEHRRAVELRAIDDAPPPASFDPWPWIGGAVAVLVAFAAGIGLGAALWAQGGDAEAPAAFVGGTM